MKRLSLLICMLVIALFSSGVNGCDDVLSAESEEEGETLGFNYDAEPGTCDGWKVRYCEAYVLCGHGTVEECIFDAEFVACHRDAPYSDCEAAFQEVIDEDDCSLFPRECYPRDIADRSDALELCEAVQEAACEYDFFCGFASNLETCVTETSHYYECDERISAVPGGEACVTALNSAACGDSLPEACKDHTRH